MYIRTGTGTSWESLRDSSRPGRHRDEKLQHQMSPSCYRWPSKHKRVLFGSTQTCLKTVVTYNVYLSFQGFRGLLSLFFLLHTVAYLKWLLHKFFISPSVQPLTDTKCSWNLFIRNCHYKIPRFGGRNKFHVDPYNQSTFRTFKKV